MLGNRHLPAVLRAWKLSSHWRHSPSGPHWFGQEKGWVVYHSPVVVRIQQSVVHRKWKDSEPHQVSHLLTAFAVKTPRPLRPAFSRRSLAPCAGGVKRWHLLHALVPCTAVAYVYRDTWYTLTYCVLTALLFDSRRTIPCSIQFSKLTCTCGDRTIIFEDDSS